MKLVIYSFAAAGIAVFGCSCGTTETSMVAKKNSKPSSVSLALPQPDLTASASANTRPRVRQKMTVRTTSYSCKENEKGGIYGNKSAVGTPLRYGAVRSAAADWSRFPMGTKFRIVGQPHLYVVDDYGSALVGTDTVDIYKPTLAMMREWGTRYVDIEVLQWGSFEQSAQILEARTHVAHTRQMYQVITAKLNAIAARSGASAAFRQRG